VSIIWTFFDRRISFGVLKLWKAILLKTNSLNKNSKAALIDAGKTPSLLNVQVTIL
jgi:hypothetical protein